MKNVNKYFFTFLTFTALNVYAESVIVKNLDLKQAKGLGLLTVKLQGNLNENPELNIVGKTIELKIPNAHTNKIVRKFGDVTLIASQLDRSTVKVLATLPSSLVGKESLVNVTLKDGEVALNFPSTSVVATNTKISRGPSVIAEKTIDESTPIGAEKLDENYLQKIEKEQIKLAEQKHPEVNKDTVNNTNESLDRVKLSQSAVQKATGGEVKTKEGETKSSFSVIGYIGKFVAFLSVMLLGFYGVLTLFKKGVIKKGKLGFLHSTKLVEVLSTTHVAPKRTLMMVKAHKQVFLIANSETGMQLISEINDVAGIIKTGEAEITGSNFDTNLATANSTNREFKLKNEDYVDYDSLDEMLNEPEIASETMTNAAKAIEKNPVKDSVRFSDQIKTKIKGLKQLP